MHSVLIYFLGIFYSYKKVFLIFIFSPNWCLKLNFCSGGFDAFGDTLQPQGPKPAASEKQTGSSILKGDLDSTLASLASNLDINGPKQAVKK